VTDYGAYRDIQRHRMAGQYPQRLSVDLGYSRPAELEAAGMLTRFEEAMNAAARACRSLSGEHPDEAQYVVPLAFRKRFLLSMNLREVFHFVQLRSARQGHPSYRRVAQEVHREVARVHPGLAAFMRVDLADYALSRS
jgi:thymidylate synthase ThyX